MNLEDENYRSSFCKKRVKMGENLFKICFIDIAGNNLKLTTKVLWHIFLSIFEVNVENVLCFHFFSISFKRRVTNRKLSY